MVSDEAAAASRLAWAATSPVSRRVPIHVALGDYLRRPRASEWNGSHRSRRRRPGHGGARRAGAGGAAEAARPELGTPAGTELLASLDAVTTSRRARIAAASREIPALYVVTLRRSGLALISTPARSSFRAAGDGGAPRRPRRGGRPEPGPVVLDHPAVAGAAHGADRADDRCGPRPADRVLLALSGRCAAVPVIARWQTIARLARSRDGAHHAGLRLSTPRLFWTMSHLLPVGRLDLRRILVVHRQLPAPPTTAASPRPFGRSSSCLSH